MPLLLTRDSIMHRMGSYRAGARGLLSKADSYVRSDSRAVRTTSVALSSFTFGILQGRTKGKFGLPVDLLAGAAFHVFGLFSKPYSHVLHGLGDGALATFFATTGYRVGERWGEGASLTASLKTAASGMFGDANCKPIAGGSSMADKELANLVKAG
jgi:hypothetical protein